MTKKTKAPKFNKQTYFGSQAEIIRIHEVLRIWFAKFVDTDRFSNEDIRGVAEFLQEFNVITAVEHDAVDYSFPTKKEKIEDCFWEELKNEPLPCYHNEDDE